MSRIKSRDNRDKRVELLQQYARANFPATRYMDYAVAVETYTLTKAANLVSSRRTDFGVECRFEHPAAELHVCMF